MGICLDRAAECLAQESPRAYVQQLQVASESLLHARGKGGGKAVRTELDELRSLLEPEPA